MTVPFNPCPAGAESKPGHEQDVVILGTGLAQLLTAGMPFVSAAAGLFVPLVLNGQTMCDEPPVALPTWTPTDVALTAAGQRTTAFTQSVLHFAWYYMCQCSSEPTPSPPIVPAPAGLPLIGNQPVGACASFVGALAPMTQPVDTIIPNKFAEPPYQSLPLGVTHLRLRAQIDSLGSVALTQNRRFMTLVRDIDGNQLFNPPDLVVSAAAREGELLIELEPETAFFKVEHEVEGFFSSTATGNSVSMNADVFCGAAPGYFQPECCPPDPAVLRILADLQLQVELLVARAGPTGPLEELSASPISGEGTQDLELGTRQVCIELDTLGPDAKFVPYANPDRLMRAGTIRFGNDFGWGRRIHVDATRCLFPVAADANVVSWSISPGSTGRLIQLGEPR